MPPLSARATAALCVLAGSLGVVETRSNIASQRAAERVVFAWERDGNIDLYLAALDGSGARRLTHDPAPYELPRCSADGTQLLFRRGGAAAGEVIRLDLTTLAEHRLTHDTVRDSNPQWSRDGKTIYATRRIDRFDRIVTYDTDGNNLRILGSPGNWHEVMPALSPDGRFLVHHSYQFGEDAELQLLDVSTLHPRRLTTTAGNDYEASFAGDDAVVFSSNRGGGHYRIHLLSLRSGEVRLLADTGADAWGPRHSSLSRRVVFHTGKPGAWRLMTVDLAGGAPQPFLDDGTSKSSAD